MASPVRGGRPVSIISTAATYFIWPGRPMAGCRSSQCRVVQRHRGSPGELYVVLRYRRDKCRRQSRAGDSMGRRNWPHCPVCGSSMPSMPRRDRRRTYAFSRAGPCSATAYRIPISSARGEGARSASCRLMHAPSHARLTAEAAVMALTPRSEFPEQRQARTPARCVLHDQAERRSHAQCQVWSVGP